MSSIIIDRVTLHLHSQTEFRPGDAFVCVIFEIAAAGFRVRVKSGRLKSLSPPIIDGKSTEEVHIFKIEDDARRYFSEHIESLARVGLNDWRTRDQLMPPPPLAR